MGQGEASRGERGRGEARRTRQNRLVEEMDGGLIRGSGTERALDAVPFFIFIFVFSFFPFPCFFSLFLYQSHESYVENEVPL
jgi:hypothetical protein